MNVAIKILSAAVFTTMLTACQHRPQSPVQRVSKPVSDVSEVTVTEMEPDAQLFRALEDFARNENGACAAEIKEAAYAMRAIAVSAEIKHKSAIEQSATEMDSLAARITKGQVRDIGAINAVLGKAGRALAAYRLSVTENEVFRQSEGNTGELLAKTIRNLEKSVSLHQRALTPDEKQVLGDAMTLAQQLEHGIKVDEDDLKTSFQQVNGEIEKWNHEFDTH